MFIRDLNKKVIGIKVQTSGNLSTNIRLEKFILKEKFEY